jgi:hypothetical protein
MNQETHTDPEGCPPLRTRSIPNCGKLGEVEDIRSESVPLASLPLVSASGPCPQRGLTKATSASVAQVLLRPTIGPQTWLLSLRSGPSQVCCENSLPPNPVSPPPGNPLYSIPICHHNKSQVLWLQVTCLLSYSLKSDMGLTGRKSRYQQGCAPSGSP